MDVYEAIEAVTKGQKVCTKDMDEHIYWFMRNDVIWHRGLGDSEKDAGPARIGAFMDDKFELVPKPSLSDKVFSIPQTKDSPNFVDVIEIDDLVPKMKELKDFINGSDDVECGTAIVLIDKLNSILGEKLSKKVGE